MTVEIAKKPLTFSFEPTFRQLFDQSALGMGLAPIAESKWIDVNNALCEMLGRTHGEMLNISWSSMTHVEDIESDRDLFKQMAEGNLPSYIVEKRFLHAKGHAIWVKLTISLIRDDNGNPDYKTVFVEDIRDRKVAELGAHSRLLPEAERTANMDTELRTTLTKLAEAKQRYETILSATPDFIYVFEFGEPEHRFAYANAELLKMFGLSYEDTVGKTFLEIGYEPWHAEMHNKEIDLVRATKLPHQGEVPFNGTYGKRIYDYIFSPVFNQQGDVIAVAGITRDVTERHNAEERLRKNEELLQQADQRKDEFLAMLAHELRNPLAPISAATQIMALSEYNEIRVRKSCEIIERQVHHMAALIDDLMDVSRVTRGLVMIEKTPQNMQEVISSSLEQVRPLFEIKHHEVKLDLVASSVPVLVLGDYKRLVQVIANVLNNAAKYTQEHGVIRVVMNTTENAVMVRISDNGIGIAPHDQQNIFALFAQAKRSSDRSQGGLGIGLALVQSILKLHDGSITCHSPGLGLGSEFVITLPLLHEQKLAESINNPTGIDQQKQLSVLVVDDNVDAAITLASLLELMGHKVNVCHDAWQTLEMIDVEPHDLCILDIGLPKMDGNELARRIKGKESMAKSTLIAVTGYGQESDKSKAFESGFAHHLTKPVSLEKLIEIIDLVASKK